MKLAPHRVPMRNLLWTVLVCAGLSGCQQQSAKWEFARGELLAESGQPDLAIQQMRNAVSRMESAPRLNLRLATELAKQGNSESLQRCDEVLQSPWGQQELHREYAWQVKSRCQQHLGQFEQALATYKQVLADRVVRTTDERNGLAYYRALAGRELMMATQDIEKAIQSVESQGWPSNLYLRLPAKTAIAIGVVSRRIDLNSRGRAIAILNRQIQQTDRQYAEVRGLISAALFVQMQSQFPLKENSENETRILRNRQDIFRNSLASMLTIRALLYQDAGELAHCNEDRHRIQELGFEADQLARQLPSLLQCYKVLQASMMYLDTRGFIYSRLPWYETGLSPDDLEDSPQHRLGGYHTSVNDITLALDATDFLKIGLVEGVFNSPDLTVSTTKKLLEELNHTRAVLLYHRMLAHQRGGQERAALADEQQIRDLGFEPGDHLF